MAIGVNRRYLSRRQTEIRVADRELTIKINAEFVRRFGREIDIGAVAGQCERKEQSAAKFHLIASDYHDLATIFKVD